MYKIDLLNDLNQLQFAHQLAFGYLTCERLYPNYLAFSKNYNFGNPLVLQAAISYIKSGIFNGIVDGDIIEDHALLVDAELPYPENFPTILASSALDAGTAIHETLLFMLDRNISHLSSLSIAATDSIDMFVIDRDDLDINDNKICQKVLQDPLMKNEIGIQNDIISILISYRELTLPPHLIESLLQTQLKRNNQSGSLNI